MNNKTNFSLPEIGLIVVNLPAGYTARVNKAGNITVQHRLGTEFWTLYFKSDKKYLWRHHDGSGYCYPLNMCNRKNMEHIVQEWKVNIDGEYKTEKFEYYAWDMNKNASFDTFVDAVNYFKKYINKYRPNGCFR